MEEQIHRVSVDEQNRSKKRELELKMSEEGKRKQLQEQLNAISKMKIAAEEVITDLKEQAVKSDGDGARGGRELREARVERIPEASQTQRPEQRRACGALAAVQSSLR